MAPAPEQSTAWPTELRLRKDKAALTIAFDNGEVFEFPAEFLRVYSPSAEVQGHSPDERKTVGGKVAVVDPEVANGTMTVDVQMDYGLPPGINLQEAVEVAITVGGLTNAVYVGRPAFVVANSMGTLFKIEPDGHSAKRVPVQFGATSTNLIDIKSGLQPGNKVILSDMSQYDGVGEIDLR